MEDKKELDMDVIGNISSDVCDIIMSSLSNYKLSVSSEKMIDIVDNDIYESVRSKLEQMSNGNYPNQMG